MHETTIISNEIKEKINEVKNSKRDEGQLLND